MTVTSHARQTARIPCAAALLLLAATLAPAQTRWNLTPDGGIEWRVASRDAHHDEIEMSGEKVSVMLRYSVASDGTLALRYNLAFPTLRIVPNLTSDSLRYTFAESESDAPRIFVAGRAIAAGGRVARIGIRGLLTIDSTLDPQSNVTLRRTIFPSTTEAAVIENDAFTNHGTTEISVEVEATTKHVLTAPSRGVTGSFQIDARVVDPGVRILKPGTSTTFTQLFAAAGADEPLPQPDPQSAEAARRTRVAGLLANLQLETPDPLLNTAFAFAKIRTAESVFRTRGGLMHSPGGSEYYAAIWANDQAEYAAPFFPFLGDPNGDAATRNTFRLFAAYMNPRFDPIPSSIISEGATSWGAAGDRGDMAMIAYGAARYALASGDRTAAEETWPLIAWSLEYCRRHLNPEGVVLSDSDELEGRFPHGKANLNTSALYYDALRSAVFLSRELGRPSVETKQYAAQADALAVAFEHYFDADLHGFPTYRYFEGGDTLRGWIATPLTMGLLDRDQGTVAALFSPALWSPDGVRVTEGNEIFWDRTTLYALRGAFAAGATEPALQHLVDYTTRRLLGEHVPYAVEQGPRAVGAAPFYERHLAGESALFCRVFTEGLFSIRPTGLRAFTLSPRLPAAWNTMALRHIRAFGADFDLVVTRSGTTLLVEVLQAGQTIAHYNIVGAKPVTITLPGTP